MLIMRTHLSLRRSSTKGKGAFFRPHFAKLTPAAIRSLFREVTPHGHVPRIVPHWRDDGSRIFFCNRQLPLERACQRKHKIVTNGSTGQLQHAWKSSFPFSGNPQTPQSKTNPGDERCTPLSPFTVDSPGDAWIASLTQKQNPNLGNMFNPSGTTRPKAEGPKNEAKNFRPQNWSNQFAESYHKQAPPECDGLIMVLFLIKTPCPGLKGWPSLLGSVTVNGSW